MRTRFQEWRWRTGNRLRALVGRSPQPRPCCQQPANLGPPTRTSEPHTVMRRCTVCGSRHFEATVDPGRLTLRTT